MQLSLRTIVEFYALASGLLVAFTIIGLPVKLALSVASRGVSAAIATPLLGMAVTVMAAWWWYGPLGGIDPLPRILLVLGAVLAPLLLAIRPVRRALELHEWRLTTVFAGRRRAASQLFALCFVGIGAVFFIEQTQMFTHDNFTVLSLGNNDTVDYANVSQHLLDHGPDVKGQVVDYDFGQRALGFPGGACAILASAASFTGFDVWKIMQASMLIAMVLGAYSIASLLRMLFGSGVVPHALAAIAGYGVIWSEYVVGNWFYAQMLGIVLTITITMVVRAAVSASPTERRRAIPTAVLALALLIECGLWIYPHMVVLGSVALLPLAVISLASWREFVRRGLLGATTFGTGLVVAALGAPGLTRNAIETARFLSNVQAGWVLRGLLPSEMLGFQTMPGSGHGIGATVVSVGVMVAVAVAAVLVWRGGRRRPMEALAAGIVVILVSYLVVFHREGGPSYRQWKWITFFLPLFVAGVVSIAISAFGLDRNRERGARIGRASALGFIGLTVYLASPTSMGLTSPHYSRLTLDQINLFESPALEHAAEVHIDVAPWWDSMWAAYFLRDRSVTIEGPSYYVIGQPQGDLWLQRNDSGPPPAEGFEMVAVINDTYRLVRKS